MLFEDGRVDKVFGPTCVARPILERIEEWCVPTDEDAKRRPAVQSYDREGTAWQDGRLLAVVKSTYVSEHDVYVVERGDSVYCNAYCRMKKENKV
jgi:hypothetical protein